MYICNMGTVQGYGGTWWPRSLDEPETRNVLVLSADVAPRTDVRREAR